MRANRTFVLGAGALLLSTFTFILASESAKRPTAATAATKPAKALTRAKVNYERDIAPIFNSACAACHGADQPQAQLRLDSLAAALAGGTSGKAIVPGNSGKSSLVRRLLGLDKPQMPYGSDPLPAKQIALIRAWIDQGAKGAESAIAATTPTTQKHWSYVKPVRPEPPRVKNSAWVRNPIDNFVLARLEKEGFQPLPEADRETLIRRVSLDLIGLPPTLEEIDAFVADKSPDAYDKVVDRLLASPHYGERWARPWLDLARYADTHGYEKDDRRTAWKYRDWVIKALNQDISFREFTIEQIAGDMLPNPTTDQLVATGFNRNTMLNQEGGVDHEEYHWYALVDRVNTTASVWLGTTLACAQCHNHKFDPFTQKDYYRMLAFFDNSEYRDLNLGQGEGWVEEPQIELPTPEQEAKSKTLKAEIAKLQAVLDTPTPELESAQAKWERDTLAAENDWAVVRPSRATSKGGATLTVLDDQSVLAGGKNPQEDVYEIEARTGLKSITGVRLEVLRDASLPRGGPGRDPEGNFFLSAVEVTAAPADRPEAAEKVVFKETAADESQGGYNVKNLIEKKYGTAGWAIESGLHPAPPRRQAILIPEKPFGFESGTLLAVRLKHEMFHAARNLGRFRLSVTTMADPKSAVQLEAKLRPVLMIPAAQRTEKQTSELAAAYRAVAPALQPTRDRLAEVKKVLDDLGIATAMILRERPSFERPSTFLRVRGSFLSKGDKVYAGVPTSLNPLPENQMPNRLGLAYWLVDEGNPLTARVAVNRLWEQYFGRGLVETSEDFGTQGQRPSHPELLDWLATELIRQSWGMKAFHRLIVTSATYRQSSRSTPELVERDPYNHLLARGPRFRLEAEMVRDQALAASGLLSAKVGGPSVFPFQPEGVWDRPYSDEKWVLSEGEDRHRRTVYTFLRRTMPYPTMINFDAPSRESCTVRRVRTNTPLQALDTLNDPVFFEAARALARRIVKESAPDSAARATHGFRLVLARRPTPAEVERLAAFHDQQLARFQKDEKAARDVIQAGENPPSDAAELGAWTMVANVLLNLDETVTKE